MHPRTVRLLALPFLFAACGAAAQGMYKCKDAAGKITYSGHECHLLGLQPAGEVADRMNTAPAYKAPPQRPAPVQRAPAPMAQPAPAAPKEDAPNPNRRCFTIKTAKGVSTRCNDKPEEDEAPK